MACLPEPNFVVEVLLQQHWLRIGVLDEALQQCFPGVVVPQKSDLQIAAEQPRPKLRGEALRRPLLRASVRWRALPGSKGRSPSRMTWLDGGPLTDLLASPGTALPFGDIYGFGPSTPWIFLYVKGHFGPFGHGFRVTQLREVKIDIALVGVTVDEAIPPITKQPLYKPRAVASGQVGVKATDATGLELLSSCSRMLHYLRASGGTG